MNNEILRHNSEPQLLVLPSILQRIGRMAVAGVYMASSYGSFDASVPQAIPTVESSHVQNLSGQMPSTEAFNTRIGFDLSELRCKVADGSENEFPTPNEYLAEYFPKCGEQWVQFLDYLNANNVKDVRLFTPFLQFFTDRTSGNFRDSVNPSISVVSQLLEKADGNGMRVHLVTESQNTCATPTGKKLGEVMSNPDQTKQYRSLLEDAFNKIKTHPSVQSIDQLNEGTAYFEKGYFNTVINKDENGNPCIFASEDEMVEFMKGNYDVIKRVLPNTPVMISHFAFKPELQAKIQEFSNEIDGHAYVSGRDIHNHAAYREQFAPGITRMGEVGVHTNGGETMVDSEGKPCDVDRLDPSYPRFPNEECQQLFLDAIKTEFSLGQDAKVSTMYFQNANTLRFFSFAYKFNEQKQVYVIDKVLLSQAADFLLQKLK